MYNDLKTLHNDFSERFHVEQELDLDDLDVNEHNSVAAELNQELIANYLQTKNREITSLVVKQLVENDRQRQDFLEKQKKQSAIAIKTQSNTFEKKEFESPPDREFIGFLTQLVDYTKNLSLLALNHAKLDRPIKLRIEQSFGFMNKHLNDAYSSQRWIFKETPNVFGFFQEYYKLVEKISDIFKKMENGSGGLCCSSTHKKDLDATLTMLEHKLFAFPLLFNLEPRKVTIVKSDAIPQKQIELPPLNLNQEQISSQVQTILDKNFPELTPLYKLKVEKVFEKAPRVSERVMNSPVPRLSEKSKSGSSKTETAKELFHGFTKSKDYIGALRLFTESEREGCAESSLYLGRMYLEGLGTRSSFEKAYTSFKKAHAAGLCEGTYQLAKLIEKNSTDIGQKGDLRTALSLYEQAAERNHSDAITDLGYCLEKGLVGTADLARAETFYNRGVELGNPRAMNNLASLLLAKCQREGNQNNYKKIFDLFDNAAKIGYSLALANLGICYMKGIYVSQDFIAARQLFRESAEHNDPDGIFYTAYFLLKESSLNSSDENYYQAASLLRKVLLINENHSDALYYMGYLHENGLGVDQDSKTAFNTLYLKAANLGDSDAAYILGVLHEEGLDVESNLQLASEFYKRSAVQGHADAQVNLALMIMDQRTNQTHKRSQSTFTPVLIQTHKTNGQDDTRDDLDQNSPEKMIVDAAKRGNSRAKQILNADRNLESSYSHIERMTRGSAYKENKTDLLLSSTLQQPFRLGKETSYPSMAILSGKSMLNNYIRV